MNDVLAELLTLLETALSTRITSYYQGEVVVPAKSTLPALMVIGNSTRIGKSSTASDQYIHSVTVKVVANVMSYVSEEGNATGVIAAQEDLIDIIEERESNTTLKSNTVLGCLRKNANIRTGKFEYNNNFVVQYDTIRTGQFFYVSASVTLDLISDLIQRS